MHLSLCVFAVRPCAEKNTPVPPWAFGISFVSKKNLQNVRRMLSLEGFVIEKGSENAWPRRGRYL